MQTTEMRVLHACGHEHTYRWAGTSDERRFRKIKAKVLPCPACVRALDAWVDDQNLIPLSGETEKAELLGEEIRKKGFERAQSAGHEPDPDAYPWNVTDPGFWIRGFPQDRPSWRPYRPPPGS